MGGKKKKGERQREGCAEAEQANALVSFLFFFLFFLFGKY